MFNWLRRWLIAGAAEQLVEQLLPKLEAADSPLRSVIVESMLARVGEHLDYDQLATALHENSFDYAQLAQHIEASEIANEFDASDIAEQLKDEIDMDELARDVVNEIDTDEITEKVAEQIDKDEIARDIVSDFELDYSEFEIDYAALGRALVDLAVNR